MPHLTFDPEHPWRWRLITDGIPEITMGGANLSPSGYIWGVEVYEEYRGRGHGRELMRMMIEAARRQGHCWVRLRVHEENVAAINLYISLGFAPTGYEGFDSNGHWVEFELEFEGEYL